MGGWGFGMGGGRLGFGGIGLTNGRGIGRVLREGHENERGWGIERRALGFEKSQLVEVAVEGAVVGVHTALEAAQLAAGVDVGLARDAIFPRVCAGGDLG